MSNVSIQVSKSDPLFPNLLVNPFLTDEAAMKCLNCYEKKVKCDFSPELDSCSRCRQHNLECIIPDGNPAKARSSLRQASPATISYGTD